MFIDMIYMTPPLERQLNSIAVSQFATIQTTTGIMTAMALSVIGGFGLRAVSSLVMVILWLETTMRSKNH